MIEPWVRVVGYGITALVFLAVYHAVTICWILGWRLVRRSQVMEGAMEPVVAWYDSEAEVFIKNHGENPPDPAWEPLTQSQLDEIARIAAAGEASGMYELRCDLSGVVLAKGCAWALELPSGDGEIVDGINTAKPKGL